MIGPFYRHLGGQRTGGRSDIGGVNIVWIKHLCRGRVVWELSIYAREWGLEEWFGLRIKSLEVHSSNVLPFPSPAADFIANLGPTFPPFDKYQLL